MGINRVTLVAATVVFSLGPAGHAPAQEPIVSRNALIADARQLLAVIESTHPDPYTACGGRIQFHRNFHDLLASIPADGTTVTRFHRLMLPFVASVGDGHTAVRPPTGSTTTPSGLSIQLGIVERTMYIRNEIRVDGRPLLGARLLSLEGVGFDELLERQNRLRGIENEYGTMALLDRSLRSRESLAMLLPEWNGENTLRFGLLLADGSAGDFEIPLGDVATAPAAIPKSRISLPAGGVTDVSFTFLDTKRETALLSIRDMMAYREGCEAWLADGLSEAGAFIRDAFSRLHEGDPPQDLRLALAGIPSAAETFRDLGLAMREAQTRRLIIDLRDNTGGNGYMIRMLLYTLFGDEAMREYSGGYSIARYSDLYFRNYTSIDLRQLNEGRAVPLAAGDYDFGEEERYREKGGRGVESADDIAAEIAKSPTFAAIHSTGRFGGIHAPPVIVVLSSPLTYSSGFNLMTALHRHGAVLVGTPSAQPGNNYGDSLVLRLQNTGIQAFIAFKQVVSFPDDPAGGRYLPVDYPLSYAKLASYGFDPNAEVLLALEVTASRS